MARSSPMVEAAAPARLALSVWKIIAESAGMVSQRDCVGAVVPQGVEDPPVRWRKMLPLLWLVVLIVAVGTCASICSFEFPPVGQN